MKIYLDNNLGVSNVEQEELTQDTIGYNILKVYIPNAVLTPYDTFTCYYGALLQNGRKVGWFAMKARTSTDADYEANYTLYKATLEQCVVSVEGKVYIGCQVLLGNSGNATLIKKNTAVVQFNVRKSVAINNDILVLDTDQTNTDVLESYKNLLENALTTYATKAEVYTKAQVDALLLQKQNVLTFDSTPTANSTNPVTSGGVKTALDTKADSTTVSGIDNRVGALETDVDTLQNNTYTKTEVNSALALKADKSNTYTKTEVDEKIDDISAYTKSEIDTMINAKADKTTVEGINTRVGALETDIADLKSVQNVVEVVATKSALNSYDTTKLDANDKVQVIADETHDGASTIYNWNGSAWVYVGAFGGNSYTKAETYNKTQIDSALSDKADKSNTYTRTVIDSMILTLSTDKADKSNTYTKTEIDNTMQEVGEIVETLGKEVEKKANAEYISKGTTLTQTSYSNTNPNKSGKVKLYKLGGMSYKVNGTIQHSAVTQIRSKNGSTIVDSLSIPSYIRNIDGYGWGIDNTCYNYIDFATKKFVQKVGCVVLNGTESSWEDRPNYTYADRFVLNASGFLSPSEKGIVNWAGFEYIVTAPTTYPYVSNYNGHIMVNFSAKGTTTLAQFKEYLGTNNLIVYYELATPIETDISEYLTTDTLEVVEGGTLEFLNTYNQAVPNEVAYLFNAVTLNNIVDSNGNTNVIATKQELNEKSTVIANPTLAGTEADLTGIEVDGIKYKVPQGGGGGGGIEIVEVTVTNWGTMDVPVHTNLTQEQMEKLSNNALIKVIDESAEWTPTICYPCAEITEENSVAYFSWISNATDSSGMHGLFQYLVAVDFLNSILTPMILLHELDTAKMSAITDANGNPRFIEGNGTPATISGVTSLYCKWSLSGTHLMLVYALTLDNGTGLPARTDICSFELPQWILDKIYPASNGLVNMVDAIYVPEGNTPTTKQEWLYKTATGLKITNKTAVQATTTCYLRIQFDLLIDSE